MIKPIACGLLSIIPFHLFAFESQEEPVVNRAVIESVEIANTIHPGRFNYNVTVRNEGENSITSLTFNTSVGSTDFDRVVSVPEPLQSGESCVLTISNVPNPGDGNYFMTTKLLRVNGIIFQNTEMYVSMLTTYTTGYMRHPLMEVLTSSSCGYCPEALVTMDWTRNNLPDWNIISFHVDDPMAITDYPGLPQEFTSSLPNTMVDRVTELKQEGLGNVAELQGINEELTDYPAYAGMGIDWSVTDTFDIVDLILEMEFTIDCEGEHAVDLIITEDKVGPYLQKNSFSGSVSDNIGDWVNKGAEVETVFNNVARGSVTLSGEECFPDGIRAYEVYRVSASMPLDKVESNEFNVISTITNVFTGEVVNSYCKAMFKDPASVNMMPEEELWNGKRVYTIDGRLMDGKKLSPGIYIEKCKGKTRKFRI